MTTITIDELRAELLKIAPHGNGNRAYAVPMLDAMEKRAGLDEYYATNLRKWLNEGGTVRLRHCLARPFKHDLTGVLAQAAARPCAPYPFDDCWTALDSCWRAVAFQKGIRRPDWGEAPSAPADEVCDPVEEAKHVRPCAPGALPEARDVEEAEPITFAEVQPQDVTAQPLPVGTFGPKEYELAARADKIKLTPVVTLDDPHPAIQQHQDIMQALQLARDILDAAIARELRNLQRVAADVVRAKKGDKA